MNTEITKDTLELVIHVSGEATSNLAEYRPKILDMIKLEAKELVTDADFARAKEVIKLCKEQETHLKNELDKAMMEAGLIYEVKEKVLEFISEISTVRLKLTKQETADKENRKNQMVSDAVSKITTFRDDLIHGLQISGFTGNLDAYYTDQITAVIYGKAISDKTQKSVDSEVEALKLAAEQQLNLIASNKALVESQENSHLFNDMASLVVMPFMQLKTVIDERNAGEKERLELLQKQEQEKARLQAEKDLAEKEAEKARLQAIEAEKENARIVEETRQFEEAQKEQGALRTDYPELDAAITEGYVPDQAGRDYSENQEIRTTEQQPTQVEPPEKIVEELPEWMDQPTVNENLPVDGVQTFQLTFQATQEEADGIQSYVRKIYMGSSPTLTLANQQG